MNFKNTNRYTVPAGEASEPGSNNQVLKNYLGIKNKKEIELLEKQELERTELEVFSIFDKDHQFTAEDICNIHELWLGDIYPSAGQYRSVNMVKDGFPFASSKRIPSLMQKFEHEVLAKYTPCHLKADDALAHALGVVHVELIMIHPFREGNGRAARLLADLMAAQADRPPLNYAPIDQTQNKKGFEAYILAIHASVNGDYEPIQTVFETILKSSLVE